MVVWFKQSLRKLNEAKRETEIRKEEISELQDAVIEIAGIVEAMSAEAGGKDGDGNG